MNVFRNNKQRHMISESTKYNTPFCFVKGISINKIKEDDTIYEESISDRRGESTLMISSNDSIDISGLGIKGCKAFGNTTILSGQVDNFYYFLDTISGWEQYE